jgi:uncharacterized protein
MSRVVHFEVHASNPEALIAFYTGLFGWSFTKWEGPMPYWLIVTGPDGEPGINGGLVPRRGAGHGEIVNAFVCTVQVDDVDATLRRGVELGGEVAVPKMPIPGMGWLGYLKDPDGNIFGAMANDPAAK